jgi:OOP family OmpA-OmpF porin
MHTNMLRFTLCLSFLLAASLAGAQPVEGYATGGNSPGIARDGFGGCVRTMMWRPELAVEGCDGFVAKPKPVAAAPKPMAAQPPAVVPAPPPPAPAPVFAPVPAPAPAPLAVAPAVAAPKPTVRSVDLRGDALFAVNSAALRPEAQPGIDQMAARGRSFKELHSVEIVGHTDSTGAADYNQKLSERRAESVKAALVKGGIDSTKIKTSGMGARAPIADNKTADGRAKNRRVTITVTATE